MAGALKGQNLKGGSLKNDMLPQEITLPPQTAKIIDSVFVMQSGIAQLETVQVFDLRNGILVSGKLEYFQKGILIHTTIDQFNKNGNLIESATTFHLKNSTRTFRKKRDEHENMTQLTTLENGKEHFAYYKNVYRKNQLAEQWVLSPYTGAVTHTYLYGYDRSGNLRESRRKGADPNTKTVFEYNKQNQITLKQDLKSGQVDEKMVYFYDQGRLQKTEWYERLSPNPMIENYTYNKSGQLVQVRLGKSNDKTEYKDFDEFGNWQIKEQYDFGELNRLTIRRFLIR
ncbi:hypothetical protein CHA01nite_37850 [Chryseobacterium hagamense]|uniref:Uncharacterized protein n=2 Tax=Chryseobacterium hagamense TaxID=395935 RepID=A0A511YS78_9FLAO|nr:hypothetical protein CHA01nite_37850 [Chryseobacterium hagamense]